MSSPFNDYDENGVRVNRNGARTTRIEDEAILYNLRFRWKQELAHIPDAMLVNLYDDFAYTEEFGNNDEHFLQFVKDHEE